MFTTRPDVKNRVELWSSGGGTQSAAIAVLIAEGKLPKPDLAVMVNTERELTRAIEYNNEYIKPLLESVGVEYHIIKKSDYTDDDLTPKNNTETTLPPFFNSRDNVTKNGRQPSWCSGRWKTDVVHRFANEKFPKSRFVVWLGMSVEELRRMRRGEPKWLNWYPLIDLGFSRTDSIRLVEKYGLPTPPRSACWMCPNRHHTEWQDMKDNDPEDFQRAIKFQEELSKKWPHLWLTSDKKPLEEIEFTNGSDDMFSGCNSGMCFN